MNKYQEAFENIKNECAKYHNFDIIDDFITLEELVKKATPKKVKKQGHSYDVNDEYIATIGICPSCKKWIAVEPADNYNYCQYCGQKLDWGDTDE